MAAPDSVDDTASVCRETRVFVVTRQIDGDRVVPRLLEKGHHTVPVPGHAASTRNENKPCHDVPSAGADAQKHSPNDNNSIERKTGPHGL